MTPPSGEALQEIIRRHKERINFTPYGTPEFKRMARIRWRLYNAEIGLNGRFSRRMK